MFSKKVDVAAKGRPMEMKLMREIIKYAIGGQALDLGRKYVKESLEEVVVPWLHDNHVSIRGMRCLAEMLGFANVIDVDIPDCMTVWLKGIPALVRSICRLACV